jgi:hypothetical protein
VLGARVGLIPQWFLDAGATGSISLFREEDAVRAVPAVTAGASIGTIF